MRMRAKPASANFRTIFDLRFGGASSTSLGAPAAGRAGAGAIVLCGGGGGGAETGVGGEEATTAGAARGGSGTRISCWHDGQLIRRPE